MAGETLHAPRERLSSETLALHQALTSLIEELEAIDWYRQRADDCEDVALRDILLHNMREEIEHAAMVLEWIRRRQPDFDRNLREFLFTDGPITGVEAGHKAAEPPESAPPPASTGDPAATRFTVGPMKQEGEPR